jgi:hypothetical protein
MGYFHNLLFEEMLFSLHKGKNDGLRYEVIIFYPFYFVFKDLFWIVRQGEKPFSSMFEEEVDQFKKVTKGLDEGKVKC